MERFESLSKEELINRLKLAMDVATAVDGMWFMNVEKVFGFDKTNEINLKVWEHYPKVLERRMKKYYELKKTGMEGVKEMIQLDPILVPMDFEFVDKDDQNMIFRVNKCPGLEAQERMNRTEFTCEKVEKVYLSAFAEMYDPRIKVKALKVPPRASENDICCEWLFTIEKP